MLIVKCILTGCITLVYIFEWGGGILNQNQLWNTYNKQWCQVQDCQGTWWPISKVCIDTCTYVCMSICMYTHTCVANST
jgi:hypothetical protein